jgi:hypothetical protein
MDKQLLPYSDIFHTSTYDKHCAYVHLMQNLDRIRFETKEYPLEPALLIDTDLLYLISYDLVYLKNVYSHMHDNALQSKTRRKYVSTWRNIRKRHRVLLDLYENSGFDPRAISDIDWSDAISRVGTSRGFHG